MTPKFEFEVVESGEPRREETPDVFLRRVHEGEDRALRLLALDRPDLALGFDARFSARLDTLRLSEREALESAVDVAWTAGQAARLDALLALDSNVALGEVRRPPAAPTPPGADGGRRAAHGRGRRVAPARAAPNGTGRTSTAPSPPSPAGGATSRSPPRSRPWPWPSRSGLPAGSRT
jgi:hypothetical protein